MSQLRRRLFTLTASSLMFLLASTAGFAVEPGTRGALQFPVVGPQAPGPILRSVRLSVLTAPSWLEVLPGSVLGPVDIRPGEHFTFRLDYVIGAGFAGGSANAELQLTIRSNSSDFSPDSVWTLRTNNGFQTMGGDCLDSRGVVCGRFRSPDRTRPRTALNFSGPSFLVDEARFFVSTATLLVLDGVDVAGDNEEVSGNLLTGISLDQPVFGLSEMTVSSAPLRLIEGPHYLSFASMDRAGNSEAVNAARVDADGTAPDTALSIAPIAFPAFGTPIIGARSELRFVPVDPVSNDVVAGVRETLFAVEDSTFLVISGTMTLTGPDGPKNLRWFSRDNVLNEEAVKSTTVVLDATPPARALSCPSPSAPAFCRVFEGVIPIRGSVSDLHLASWRLEWAPGRGAVSGFSAIASGTGPASGDLASWDASSLSGYVTLRLTAEDAVANVSTQSVVVYVGDPARVYALGGRKTFDKPTGVAVDTSSRVYVADAGRDRIFVYDAQGIFVRAYGTDGRSEPALKQPAGVALDAAGNVYVADTGNHRVVKLAPEGGLLAAWGRSETKRGLKRFKPGKAPGEFRRPGALAVDAAGRVVVADTGNRRLQVIGSGGAVERVIDMPPVPDDDPDEEDGTEGDASSSRGVPAGVAVDGTGRIYAADRKGARVVVFGASGNVLRTLSDRFEQPTGVAVSADGKCLAVSDRELDFIRRYDEDGRRLLSFGVEGEAKDAAALAAALVMKKPLGLALGPDGALYAADSGNGLVQGFAPPSGPPVVSVGEAEKRGGGFRAAAVAAASQEPPFPAVATIAASGGALRRADRAGVEVPEAALDEGLALGVYEPTGLDERRVERAKASRRAPAGPAVEYGPHGLTFDRPVTLVLPYEKALAARNGWRAADLTAQHWDEAQGDWETLPGRVDEAEGVVRVETTHFSLYQVHGPEAAASAPAALPAAAVADASFAFRDLYAFPNPARGGRRAVIRLQAGVADSVEVNIYDVSGERVHSGAFGPPTVLDDGNGKGPQWTYDYAWDAGGVGSGVYIFAVTAKKGGQAEVRKSGRLAVLK